MCSTWWKKTHIAEKMELTGVVYSLDLHEHKVKLINDNASRLGLGNIKTMVLDVKKSQENILKKNPLIKFCLMHLVLDLGL